MGNLGQVARRLSLFQRLESFSTFFAKGGGGGSRYSSFSSLFPPSPFGTFRLLLLPGNYCRRLLPVPRKNSLREEKAGKRMGRKLGVYFPLRFPSEKRAGRGKEIESPSASLHRLLAIWLPSGLGSLSISPPFPPENPSRKRNTHETTIDLPSPPIFLFPPFLIPFSFLFLPFISEIQLSFHPLLVSLRIAKLSLLPPALL